MFVSVCVCLLNNDLDLCNQIEGMARAAETEYRQISMGQVGVWANSWGFMKMKTF